MMNHARVKALKGEGKTVSKKAIKSGKASGSNTPNDSPLASMLTSPRSSKPPSRAGSDVSDDDHFSEDSSFEDDMSQSLHSDMSNGADHHATVDINALLEQLKDKKHNNNEQRERLLSDYIKVVRLRYNEDSVEWLNDAGPQLVEIFIRDANRSGSARERLLSLQACCVTLLCSEEIDIVESELDRLKQILVEDDDEGCKEWAIYAIGLTALYGGGDEETVLYQMEYLTEIVSSDGDTVDSLDSTIVVAAALRTWMWLAAHIDDYSTVAWNSIDSIVEQLDSSDAQILTLASQSIALIFEGSREHEENTGSPFPIQYDPARLAGRIEQVAKSSYKSVARSQRRNVREALRGVVTSLKRGVGPAYSEALNGDQKEYGYRMTFVVGNQVATIKFWYLAVRYEMLKTVLRGGVSQHIVVNPVVKECMEDAQLEKSKKTDTKKGMGAFREE